MYHKVWLGCRIAKAAVVVVGGGVHTTPRCAFFVYILHLVHSCVHPCVHPCVHSCVPYMYPCVVDHARRRCFREAVHMTLTMSSG